MITRSVRLLAGLGLVPLLLGARADAAPRRPNVHAYYDAKPVPGAVLDERRLPPAFVASRDERRGVPAFLWAIRSGPGVVQRSPAGATPEDAALAHLALHAPRYGLSPAALSTVAKVRVLDLGRGGIVVVLRQSVGGVELFHSDVKVLMDRSLELVAIAGSPHAGAVPGPKTPRFSISQAQAVAAALNDLYGKGLAPADVVALTAKKAGYTYHQLGASRAAKAAGIRLTEPVRAKPVLFPLPDRLVPAYYLEVIAQTQPRVASDAYAYVIAADDGRLLYREDLRHDDAVTFRVWADATGDQRPADGPITDYTPHPTGTPGGSYPPYVPSSLISIAPFNKTMDPWLPAGATESQGNNVDAYTDDDAPEGFSPGDTRALATSPGVFDHTFDPTLGPQASLEQREAAVTQMFYVTNWLHDWWYDSGFDEGGGNAQTSNYGRGGVEGDPLLAEGQLGAPAERDNENIVCPADGMSPRMHMLVWTGKAPRSLTLQPGNQTPAVGVAAFGPLSYTGPVATAVVLADDGTAPDPNDGCDTLVNAAAVSGKVALVNRGNCTFKLKVVNAQAAGAVGVILADNRPNEPPPIMGDDPTTTTAVTIPVMSISQTDGATLKGELPGETATFARGAVPDLDSSVDGSLVAHEWGHYLHLRHVACTNQQCLAESEGWADFNALMMMVRKGDKLTGTFAVGQYVTQASPDDPAYFGIRRYPYSVDMSKSPLTFKYITNGVALPPASVAKVATGFASQPNAEVHAAGEIWASMLFEGYVAMLQQAQGASPPYTFDEARRRMSDYVVAGMAFAPGNPTYTEQRDAILAVASAVDPKDMALLAAGFAKRGAGTCAVSPARDSVDFSGAVESFTLLPNLAVEAVTLDDGVTTCDAGDGYLDAGETGHVTVTVKNTSPTAFTGATVTLSTTTPGATFPSGATVTLGDVPAFGSVMGTAEIALAPSFQGKQQLALTATANGTAGCANGKLSILPYVNVVEVPASATVDDMEASTSTWTPSGPLAAMLWSRGLAAPGNRVWSGTDFAFPTDTALLSPPLDVSPTASFVMTFDHAHSFAAPMGVDHDGAVIEISTDGGTTWHDISMYGNPGYGGTIRDPFGVSLNVLKGRQGYVETNPSWPAMDTVTIDMGTKLAGATVQVRFRIGTDFAGGAPGWQLDNVGFQGITNKPFTRLVADTVSCSASSSSGSASSSGGTGGSTGTASSSVTTSSSATSSSSSHASSAGGTGGSAQSSSGSGGSGGNSEPSGGGCQCTTTGSSNTAALAGSLLALSALLLRRRRD